MSSVRIEYRLRAASGILIGSTANVLSIGLDKSTMQRRQYTSQGTPLEQQAPIIPGSTLKGKARNECERILVSLGREVCHAPRADMMCPHDPAVTNSPCEICRIFGGPSHQSRLFFGDAIVEAGQDLAAFLVRAHTGVSLSRTRRTAEDERLYYFERGIEGLDYKGRIEGHLDAGSANKQLALLIAAFERLVAVGGGKSRGAGWTRFTLDSLQIDGLPISTEQWQQMQAEGFEAWRASK
ncbi:MAG: RAMP superfamily CRISPR-associated protein [Blastocatellia bacterium]